MLSALHATFGEPADVLVAADTPAPQPQAGDLQIRTLLAPIHNHDLWTIRGKYGYKPPLPAVAGSEAVGIIEALGEGVAGFQIGQRVAVAGAHGTWTERFVAPSTLAVPLPAAVPDEIAAQLLAMPLSALFLLDFLQVKAGQWIIQNTANGAVGKTLAILAKARGVDVINLVRRDEAVAELAALGIEHAVSTSHDGWQQQVQQRVGGAVIVAGVDSIGGQASGEMMALLGEGGALVAFGRISGEPMQIDATDLIFRQVTVRGFWASLVSQRLEAGHKRRLVGELLTQAAQGALVLPVQGIYGLAEVGQAVAASLVPGRQGKVLLRP